MAAVTEAPPRPALHRGSSTLRLGYVPLTDAAPLLVADALGMFGAVGLRVGLSPEAGWAAIRDKLAFGALDAAHLLGPLPIALALGLGGVKARLTVAAGLGANGNTITLSTRLADAIGPFARPLESAAFARAARQHGQVTLAVVFPFSSHNYLLRHWLAAGGLDPEHDIRLTVIPPPQVARALADGRIDGFCAGEPWGSQAVALGAGRIALASGDIWPDHPEKVLAFAEGRAERDPEAAIACTAAVIAAARWLDDPANHGEAVRILARHAMADVAPETLADGFAGRAMGSAIAHPLRFRRATLPRREGAAWFLGQMRRWGHVPAATTDDAALAPWTDRLWREAARRLGEPEPESLAPPPFFSPEFPA